MKRMMDAVARGPSWLAAVATGNLRRLARIAEPAILFPTFTVLILGVIWSATLNLIKVERTAAEQAAAVSSEALAETYEAQVVRALREIDLTLKFVKYACELRGKQAVLRKLNDKSLLPPALLFTVTIADVDGAVVASTRPLPTANIADQDYFRLSRQTDALEIGRPPPGSGADGGRLYFSRRLDARDGSFDGVVAIAVDAAYFVSDYETAKLGEHGLLGILGVDGVFRVRRSGDTVTAGEARDRATMAPVTLSAGNAGLLTTSAWDGVPRYTSTRKLYEFPITVVVGLSADEVLIGAQDKMRGHLWWAGAGSVVVIVLAMVLDRMSHQVTAGRLLVAEEQRRHAARVEHLAYHDSLTALPNRTLYSKLLAQSIHLAHRHDRRLAVLFLDLDRFKQINDTLGHDAGDRLLQEVAHRLKACLRDSDTVARLGGDEFVVLLPELTEDAYVVTVARKILSAISKPFVLLGQEFRVTASVGISTYPQDGLDEQTLTKNADIAMYQAKGDGKNNFRFYSHALNANSLERLTLESSLRHALKRDEFELVYQARRDIRTGAITGMEALLRWQHPELGTVPPLQFLPMAEETGLILPIGKWVLKTACLQNKAWQAQGLPPLIMAVNLTARQFFDDGLLRDVTATLAATGMERSLLELEVSEGLLMRDVRKSIEILTGLKGIGVRVAIDDFGVGYSSLAKLLRFPLDNIKIDRSFIRDAASVDDDKALTEAIVAMGRSLSRTVVAQGVETKEQADFLHVNACDELQGFYFGEPMPAAAVSSLLQTRTHLADIEAGVEA